MAQEFVNQHDKSAGDLGREALSFAAHTLLAVLVLGLIVFIFSLGGATIDQMGPKLLCTALALIGPLVVGFIVARAKNDSVAGYVWLAGVLTFSIVCVWVLDLPTGPGLCQNCGAFEKLYRTFFDISNGSGLMAGDGLLVGTWIPLSMIGYSIGAKLGLD